ncbi:CorA-like Mg2+ transporter protein [Trypanosoma brucei equiperdum]|uniref:CorA-like Mg2+ transporter protein n=1 Tax=Trypanosoma brucei equiperdum TaxID=630700 RepID=A0A3L6LBX0_9TRYP|nr:CorA-like Mg2+ transporter protein [Trypanosoma brucei equiperdum]
MPCATKGEASPPVTTPVGRDGCLCVVTWQTAGRMSLQTCALESAADALVFLRNNLPGIALCGLWVDMQKCSEEEHRQVLQLLYPNMQPSHVEAVLANDMYDVVELQPTEGEYVVGCLSCSPSHGGPFPAATAMSRAEFGCEEGVLCSFVCSERVLLTLHTAPFAGLAELFRHVLRDNSQWPMSMSAILCTLVCYTCELSLPDPTALIGEVDCIDEMMLLVAPGKRDQTDMLRRVALLRRHLSALNRKLQEKAKLISEMTGPAMRTTFVSRELHLGYMYREALEGLSQVLSRLECAQDTLDHANLNFMYAITMRMSQTSAGCDRQVMIVNKIATICLPAILVASLFGMNCKVQWVADDCDSLYPFWTIVALMIVWMAALLFQPVRDLIREKGG